MPGEVEHRRVLLTADSSASPPLLDLFGRGALKDWQALAADSFEQARFVLRHQPCDALLVNEGAYRSETADGFAWLVRRHQVPLLLLARADTGMAGFALRHGASQWLPYDLALQRPLLLAGALNQVAQITDLRRRVEQMTTKLHESRRHVDRLVGVLWRSLPADSEPRWFTHRHMLERLREEVSRARRYGDPLTVVLGEVEHLPEDQSEPAWEWLAQQIMKSKRCCDVAGQYGPHGFLLLLVHTEEKGGVAYCRRLQKILGQPADSPGNGAHALRTYFGIAADSAGLASAERLLSLAEQQLEASKAAGEGLETAV
jgi:diguanylate cyclase (GGDEF)-like protein